MSERPSGSRPLPPEGYRTSKYSASDIDPRLIPEPLPMHDIASAASAPSEEQAEESTSAPRASVHRRSPSPKRDTQSQDEWRTDPSPVPPKRDMELWIGRNALGVVAAALVFLGIAYFAVAFIPLFADEAKVALMFSLSIAVTVVGSLLTMRKENGFTTALMGCGAGSLFISVLATHLHFEMLSEAPAFALLLVWMVMCLLLVRKTQSLLLDIVLQLGLAVSVCLGFSSGLGEGKLWLLVGYQLVASVIVIGGNLMFCPRMYRSSLLLSLALSCVTSLVIAQYCWPFSLFGSPAPERPVAFVAVVFALQCASATAYAAMLAHTVTRDCATTTHDLAEGDKSTAKVRGRLTTILVVGTVLWLQATYVDVAHPMAKCLSRLSLLGSTGTDARIVGIVCQLALIAAACRALDAHARRQLVQSDHAPVSSALRLLACGGVIAASWGSLAAYSVDASLPVGLLWVWAVFAMVLARKVGDRCHTSIALACLVMESLEASVFLFPGLAPRFGMGFALLYGAAYTIGLCVLTGRILFEQDWHRVGAVLLAAMGTMLVMSYFAHCTPLDFTPWVWSISCMTCALIWVVLGFVMHHGQLRLCGLVVMLCCVVKLVVFDLAGLDPTAHTIAYVVGGLICFAVSALYNSVTRRIASQQCV